MLHYRSQERKKVKTYVYIRIRRDVEWQSPINRRECFQSFGQQNMKNLWKPSRCVEYQIPYTYSVYHSTDNCVLL
jgi:hypothetical protein